MGDSYSSESLWIDNCPAFSEKWDIVEVLIECHDFLGLYFLDSWNLKVDKPSLICLSAIFLRSSSAFEFGEFSTLNFYWKFSSVKSFNHNTVRWFQVGFRRVLGVLVTLWYLVNFAKLNKSPKNYYKNHKTPPSHEHL